MLKLLTAVLRLPGYEYTMVLVDLMQKQFINSRSSFDRRLFLDFALLLVQEFSCEYFAKNYAHLLGLYSQERSREVSMTLAKNITQYREGIGSFNNVNLFTPGQT